MEAMRQSWTDDRLDILNRKVDDGFAETGARFDQVERRLDRVDARFEMVEQNFQNVERQFGEVGQRLDRLESRLESMQSSSERRFDSLQTALVHAVIGICAAMVAGFGAIIATQL